MWTFCEEIGWYWEGRRLFVQASAIFEGGTWGLCEGDIHVAIRRHNYCTILKWSNGMNPNPFQKQDRSGAPQHHPPVAISISNKHLALSHPHGSLQHSKTVRQKTRTPRLRRLNRRLNRVSYRQQLFRLHKRRCRTLKYGHPPPREQQRLHVAPEDGLVERNGIRCRRNRYTLKGHFTTSITRLAYHQDIKQQAAQIPSP